MTRKEKILYFIQDENYIPMTYKDISAVLGVKKEQRDELIEILSDLESEGKIYRNDKNRYVCLKNSDLIKGVFHSKGKRYGFVITDDDEKFFINPGDTLSAFDSDTVLMRLKKHSTDAGKCSEAKIVKIIKHSEKSVVGTFTLLKNSGFVIPDSKNFTSDIYIPKKHCIKDADGKKVCVKITKWESSVGKNPEGYIEKVLGFEGEKGVDIEGIMATYSLTDEFPEKVMLSALSFGDRVYEEELDGRLDLRDKLIFTIDGEDAKDFDDAVSIEKIKDGYVLSVHIADVSYYVSENSVLDNEARKRGTSVYLPGKVIPMLPKHLSNGLCSLNPGVDRLTLSVIIKLDSDANILGYDIKESVINSKYRLTYDEVLKIIEEDRKTIQKYKEIAETIKTMNELKTKLKEKRLEKGSIDFNLEEVGFKLDENGKPIDVFKVSSDDAHSLIEEFMLLANVCVAEKMLQENIPSVYRIHEKPSDEKMRDFSDILHRLGFTLGTKFDNPSPKAFANLLEKIKGSPKELIITKLMLRSLMKAKYSHECLGHFGLNFDKYCHFTSPIRRYPDLVVHRILKEYLNYGISKNRERFLLSFVKKSAKSSSECEINAMEAEREMADIKKAEYMQDKIGCVYDAVISSVTSFGMFAQTEFGIEGLITMTDLDDDYYEYSQSEFTLTGKKYGKIYSIGDEIKIKVKRADILSGQIDFLIESGE